MNITEGTTWKVAFVDHVCDKCGEIIKEGEKYAFVIFEVWLDESDQTGDFLVSREHGQCYIKDLDECDSVSRNIFRKLAQWQIRHNNQPPCI